MTTKPVLLDIMVENKFYTQLRYRGAPVPSFVDGKIIPCYDDDDIRSFVFSTLPSIRGKKVRICIATQTVFKS